MWLIVGRALRPVERIRHAITDITSEDLSRRVPDPGTPDEIGGLAKTMNGMLAGWSSPPSASAASSPTPRTSCAARSRRSGPTLESPGEGFGHGAFIVNDQIRMRSKLPASGEIVGVYAPKSFATLTCLSGNGESALKAAKEHDPL